MAPNDAGQDNYAGSVEQKLRDEALRKLWEEHRNDPAWHHDPDHQLDEEAAIKAAQRQADQFIATQHDQLEHGLAMRGGPQLYGMNYLNIPHDKLYKMVNTDIDPGMVDTAGA